MDTALLYGICGGLAGFVADAVMYPVDTIKARMQVQRGSEDAVKYRSMWHAFKRIHREEGLRRGLYSGVGAVLAGTIPTHAIIFAVYHSLRGPQDVTPTSPAFDFVAGAVAEVGALWVYVPSEVVAKRMQVAKLGPARNYGSSWEALRIIYRSEGYRGLYAGTASTMVRDVPFTALQLMIFDALKRVYLASPLKDPTWGNAQSATAGFIAGGLAAAATNPFDVIKTRIQTQATGSERKYRGIWHCASRILREEGFRGLTQGTSARVLWVAPASSITLVIYEASLEYLRGTSVFRNGKPADSIDVDSSTVPLASSRSP